MEKRRNLGIDILCCIGVMLLLGLQYIEALGYFEQPLTSWAAAAPIAGRWFCLSGAALLSAGTGYILSTKKFSLGYFKIFIRLIYVYVICSVCAIALRLTVMQETLTAEEIMEAFLRFKITDTGYFAGMYFGILLAAPFLNAAFQGLPDRQARLVFVCITAAFGTLQPILSYDGLYLLPEWCSGLFPVAAYVAGAYLKRYMKKRNVILLLLILIGILAAETAIVTYLSLPSGELSCPWLDSLAALPSFGIALCMLGLFHSKKNGRGSVHRFFAGAAGGALAALLLGEPLIDIMIVSVTERFPEPDMAFWIGCGVIPVMFIICSVVGLILQLPLLGIRNLFQSAEAEEEQEEEKLRKKKSSRSEVSMPERVHTRPRRQKANSRHTISVAVSEPEAEVFLTQPEEEIPPGLREVELPKRPAPMPEPEPEAEEEDVKPYIPRHMIQEDPPAEEPAKEAETPAEPSEKQTEGPSEEPPAEPKKKEFPTLRLAIPKDKPSAVEEALDKASRKTPKEEE